MHFFKSGALLLAASLALVDARAIHVDKRHSQSNELTDTSTAQHDIKARWTNKVNGEKLSTHNLVSRLFGGDGGDDVKIVKDAAKSNAKACKNALSKLRKAKARKRADYDLEDDSGDSEDGMDLGPRSRTVPMGKSTFEGFDDHHDVDILGTEGLNSCTGVLIVGKKGAIIAHLNPIEEGDNKGDDFKDDVADKVTKLYTDNKDLLEDAKMYVSTPRSNHGEKKILKKVAEKDLEIDFSSYMYDMVKDDDYNDAYMESGKGTIFVNFKDKDNPKVFVFGDEK